jgi:hypothetical protein
VIAEINKHKHTVAAEYNLLDSECEHRVLEESEKARMRWLARELDHVWALEEIKLR